MESHTRRRSGRGRRLRVLGYALLIALGGCRAPAPESSLVARAQEFRARVRAKDHDAARAMMSPDPRRWWTEREGEGSPWTIGSPGRWAEWDEHMRSHSEPLAWSADERSVTLLVAEINDYYRLLERGPQHVRYTYFFDEQGALEGFLVASGAERSRGRVDEYLEWARQNEPDETDHLRPGGRIDPTGDRAKRTRAQLLRWRASAGLGPLE